MKRLYITNSCQEKQFDTSEEECNKFDFLAGDRISNGEQTGTVIGVAPATLCDEDPVLWVHFDGDRGAQFSIIGYVAMGYEKV